MVLLQHCITLFLSDLAREVELKLRSVRRGRKEKKNLAITLSRMGWAERSEWSLTLNSDGMPRPADSKKRAADFSNTKPHCDDCIKRRERDRPAPRAAARHLH